MKTNSFKKVLCGLFAVLTLVMVIAGPCTAAFAAEEKGSITIKYEYDESKVDEDKYETKNVKISGATFAVALVAKEGNGEFEWVDALSKFSYKAEDMFNKNKTADIANALVKDYADDLSSVKKTTSKEGECFFSSLDRGVYLIWQTEKDGVAEEYHDAAPCLVEVPDRSTDPFTMNVTVYPKASKVAVRMVSVTGTKSWKGDVLKASDKSTESTKETTTTDKKKVEVVRPKSITLRLYANGVEVGKTTTNADKNWAFSFNDVNALDKEGKEINFTIKEDAIKGYTFTQEKPKVGENTIVINVKNTAGESAPKTGDETNMGMWIALVVGCVLLAVLVIVIPSKKSKQTMAETATKKGNK